MIFDFVFQFKKNQGPHLIQLKELLRRGLLTGVKLSPDCPLVEVLREPRNDKAET